MKYLQIVSNQFPGQISIDNFDELKSALSEYLTRYKGAVYTEQMLVYAKDDKKELTRLRREIDDRRKEVKKAYTAPYLDFEAKIKELLALIDEPLEDIKSFVSEMEEREKEAKKAQIKEYFDTYSGSLGAAADSVFESPAFFDKKWLNKTTSEKTWQQEVTRLISKASDDIAAIQSADGNYTAALLSRYFEDMDFEAVAEYRQKLESSEKIASADTKTGEDGVKEYKIIRISGTKTQLSQILYQARLLGVTVDIMEDGAPETSADDITFEDASGAGFDITLPYGETEIVDYSFGGCTGLSSVTIPESVVRIGKGAFQGCTGLEYISIPESVVEIGWGAFRGCANLLEIAIPESVAVIGEFAFEGCDMNKLIIIAKENSPAYEYAVKNNIRVKQINPELN